MEPQDQVSLLLLSDPPGATLRLDGEELGDGALIKKVPAEQQDYLLTGEMDGYHDGSILCRVDMEVLGSGSLRCAVPLVRIPSSRPARTAPSPRAAPTPDTSAEEEQAVPQVPDDKPTIHKID